MDVMTGARDFDVADRGIALDHPRRIQKLVLYGTDREDGTLSRWVMQESGADVTAATLSGFDGSGVMKVPGAFDLRGLKIDAKGNFWMADLRGNKVFRVSQDGKDVKSVSVSVPVDVAIDGERVFVTRSTERAITVMDNELNVIGSLSVPWEELELSPYGNNRNGALGGIVVVPGKGFFVANEAGQTANQRSTYGRVDEHSDFVNGKMYRDIFGDDIPSDRTAEEAGLAFRQIETATRRFLKRSVSYYGHIADDPAVRESVLVQRAIVDYLPQSPASRCYRIVASRLAGLGPAQGGLRLARSTATAEGVPQCA